MTYAAEKVADKKHQHTPGDVGAVVQALKGMCLAIAIEKNIVLNLGQRLVSRQVVVCSQVALKVLRFRLVDLDALGRR